AVAPTGDDLVGIGLVSDIPDEPVVRRIEHVVERHCELDHAQARAQVSAGHRDSADRLLTQLVRELAQVAFRKLAQILRRVDAVEQPILYHRLSRRVPGYGGYVLEPPQSATFRARTGFRRSGFPRQPKCRGLAPQRRAAEIPFEHTLGRRTTPCVARLY